MNVAEVLLAGTVTEDGTVNRVGALLGRETTVLEAVDLDRVTVQAVLELEARLAATHCRLESVTGDTRERVAVADEPFKAAVSVADLSESRVPAPAVKVADAAPAATLTEEGTVNTVEAVLESATDAAAVTDFERVTVHVVLALESKLAAAHCSEDTAGRVVSESVAGWEEPFKAAVTVAV